MKPPEHQGQGTAEAPDADPAVLSCDEGEMSPSGTSASPAESASPEKLPTAETLRHRADFLRAASARRHGAGSFLLQGRERGDGEARVRVGFTASKKIGNAVARNRAKRRLREIARDALPRLARPGWDYVLVARPGATIARPFADLLADLEAALRAMHRDRTVRDHAVRRDKPDTDSGA